MLSSSTGARAAVLHTPVSWTEPRSNLHFSEPISSFGLKKHFLLGHLRRLAVQAYLKCEEKKTSKRSANKKKQKFECPILVVIHRLKSNTKETSRIFKKISEIKPDETNRALRSQAWVLQQHGRQLLNLQKIVGLPEL